MMQKNLNDLRELEIIMFSRMINKIKDHNAINKYQMRRISIYLNFFVKKKLSADRGPQPFSLNTPDTGCGPPYHSQNHHP